MEKIFRKNTDDPPKFTNKLKKKVKSHLFNGSPVKINKLPFMSFNTAHCQRNKNKKSRDINTVAVLEISFMKHELVVAKQSLQIYLQSVHVLLNSYLFFSRRSLSRKNIVEKGWKTASKG